MGMFDKCEQCDELWLRIGNFKLKAGRLANIKSNMKAVKRRLLPRSRIEGPSWLVLKQSRICWQDGNKRNRLTRESTAESQSCTRADAAGDKQQEARGTIGMGDRTERGGGDSKCYQSREEHSLCMMSRSRKAITRLKKARL